MLITTIPKKTATKPLKWYTFRMQKQELHILHVGEEIPFLQNYFDIHKVRSDTLHKIGFSHPVDIVLINNDNDILHSTENFITKSIIRYTSSYSHTPEDDLVHYSSIPALLKCILELKGLVPFQSKASKNLITERFLCQVSSCIDDHLDDHQFKLKELCECLAISRSTLSKKIKAYANQNPTQFINSYKLKKSKYFLITTNWQIGHISDMLGYSSQHYFSRLFKKEEGMTPLQYRNLYSELI